MGSFLPDWLLHYLVCPYIFLLAAFVTCLGLMALAITLRVYLDDSLLIKRGTRRPRKSKP